MEQYPSTTCAQHAKTTAKHAKKRQQIVHHVVKDTAYWAINVKIHVQLEWHRLTEFALIVIRIALSVLHHQQCARNAMTANFCTSTYATKRVQMERFKKANNVKNAMYRAKSVKMKLAFAQNALMVIFR